MFVFGDAYYGKVDSVPGLFYVKTRFLHIWWLPFVPRESVLMADDGSGRLIRGLRFSWKSILISWIRPLLAVVMAWLIFAGAITIDADPKKIRGNREVITAVVWGIAVVLAIVYGMTYWWARPSLTRAVKLGEAAGIEPAEVERRLRMHTQSELDRTGSTAPPDHSARQVSALLGEGIASMGDPLDEAERLFEKGEGFVDAQFHGAALNCFRAAWEVLPEPREEQRPAVRILAAIADASFHLGQWVACRDAVQHAFRCGADPGNPFLRLRLGQALYELGERQEAEGWLVPAYLAEGPSLFEGDDPKYLESFHGKLAPPSGG